MKKNIILSAALVFFGLTAQAQTSITFDKEDYKSIRVYDSWTESPFRKGTLTGNVAVTDNPDTSVDEVLGTAPNSTGKVVALQRSRFGSNTFGLRIDLKEPVRMTKQLQYIHVMTYLKDKPADSRMMVIGLGKRVESSWSWQDGEDEQFWAVTNIDVAPKAGWQDVVMSFKGFSYSKDDNAGSGIDIYSLIIVPDVRSPHADTEDWVAYFDEIVIDNVPDKRFSTEKYALTYSEDAKTTRKDRSLNSVGLTSAGVSYTSAANAGKVYTDNTTLSVFSAKAGAQVQPTFNYTGTWMSAYVYVDWNNDGKFEYAINDNGTPATGSEIVSYNAYQVGNTWYKSDGTTVSNGNTIGSGVPAFTIPAGTEPGMYRMRYKVDWNSIDPAGSSTVISDGGGYVDVMLDVHGDKVTVSASQLNGDIVLASDGSALQGYVTNYAQPLKVKDEPAPGFVQYGFALRYGYNVNAAEQLDGNGNPNWIEVNVPYTAIAADGTYTIPAEYIRGSQVSIKGDMQQAYKYTVSAEGADGNGGVVFAGKEYKSGDVLEVSQFFTVADVTAVNVADCSVSISLDAKNNIIKVVYKKVQECVQITSLDELDNDAAYHIKAKSGEGYLAWNTTISDTYLSLRGMTNSSYNNLPTNQAVVNIYKEEVTPFDKTVVWQIISEDGKYYLFQPAKQEYVTRVNRDYVFTAEKTALDAIRDNGDGTFGIHAGGGHSDSSQSFACIVTNEPLTAVRNWTWDDHGAVLYIFENPNIVLNESAAVEDVVTTDENSCKGIYNLLGQKLDRLPSSGIVIVDGRKYLIK
ncbi:MAG: hypothetical protein IJY44_06855 [Bacteroidaceae bacterium]|nr:hypothetical protein [Bacteroidaceae bacterium]